MYLVKIAVTLKDSVVDPAGQAVKAAATRMGHGEVSDVRIGKLIELKVDGDLERAEQVTQDLCDALLVNPNTESFTYEIISEES